MLKLDRVINKNASLYRNINVILNLKRSSSNEISVDVLHKLFLTTRHVVCVEFFKTKNQTLHWYNKGHWVGSRNSIQFSISVKFRWQKWQMVKLRGTQRTQRTISHGLGKLLTRQTHSTLVLFQMHTTNTGKGHQINKKWGMWCIYTF